MDSEVEILLLKKEILELKYGANSDRLSLRYNENHDPGNGQFTSGPGGGSGSTEPATDSKGESGSESVSGNSSSDNISGSKSQSKKKTARPNLSPKEYRRVEKAINDVYHVRFKGKGKATIYLSNGYAYTFIERDFNDYIILSKEKFDD